MFLRLILILYYLEVVKTTYFFKPECKEKDSNEIFTNCKKQRCQNTCLNPTASDDCFDLCKFGCICVDGYFIDSEGNCVLPENCDISPSCRKMNEVFSYCGDDGCQPSCSRLDVSNCVPKCSKPACICSSGFVKDLNKNCILPSECPLRCAIPHTVRSTCGNDGCQPTCENPNPTNCTPICKESGCVCNKGFVLDNFGKCILPDECPLECTAPNTIASSCGNDGCQPTCRNQNPINCNRTCNSPACICALGFVLDDFGNCIEPSECKSIISFSALECIALNTVLNKCGNDGCQPTCRNQNPINCTPICSSPACICAPGFVLDDFGNCITPTECKYITSFEYLECTAPNTVANDCGFNGCQPTCTNLNPTNCTPICRTPACTCAPGFVLDYFGNCITSSNCPFECTAPNTVRSLCGNDGCQSTCSNLNITNCDPICCTPACICASGYVLDNFGNCILPSECSLQCASPNTVFSACGNDGCQPTCKNQKPIDCTPNCNSPSCICAPGFVLDKSENCIEPSMCELKLNVTQLILIQVLQFGT